MPRTRIGRAGPVIHINGLAFWGAVDVRRKPPKGGRHQELKARRREVESGNPEEWRHPIMVSPG